MWKGRHGRVNVEGGPWKGKGGRGNVEGETWKRQRGRGNVEGEMRMVTGLRHRVREEVWENGRKFAGDLETLVL